VEASVWAVTARASALVGTLTDLPLPELLGFLTRSGQTGVARFTGPVPAEVHLEDGRVVFADTGGDPTLDRHLAASGLDAATVVAAAAATGRGVAWADALVDAGIPAVEVRGALYDHTVNALFELLLSTDDEFAFDPGTDATDGGQRIGGRFPMELESLLADAERRRRQWTTISATVPSTAVVLRIAPSLPGGVPSVTLSADDWKVIASFDGRRMLSDTVRDLGRTSFSVCEVVHRLLGTGVIERA